MSDQFRVVQVNEDAFTVEELGTLFWVFSFWWTWHVHAMDCSWVAYFKTKAEALEEIEKTKKRRKQIADAKAFQRKVVWP